MIGALILAVALLVAAGPAAAHDRGVPTARASAFNADNIQIDQPAPEMTTSQESVVVSGKITGGPPRAVTIRVFNGGREIGTVSAPFALLQLVRDNPDANVYSFGPVRVGLAAGTTAIRPHVTTDQGTFAKSVSVNHTPLPPTTNFFATGLEATQVIQGPVLASDTRRAADPPSLRGHPTGTTAVPLIAHKPTAVRVYAAVEGTNGAAVGNVSALISGVRAGTDTPLDPPIIRPVAPASPVITVPPVSSDAAATGALRARQRTDAAQTFNFTLPPSWQHGSIDLTALVNDTGPTGLRQRECDGCVDGANFLKARLNFTLSGGIALLPWKVQIASGGVLHQVDPLPASFFDSVGRLFPVAPQNVWVGQYRGTIRGRSLDCGDLLDQTDAVTSLGSEPTVEFAGKTSFVGVLPSKAGVDDCSGMAELSGEDFVTKGGDTSAHELGHNLGLAHSSCSHGEEEGGGCDAGFPYAHGGIGPVVGFDLQTMRVRAQGDVESARQHDFMSYGPSRWTSLISYQRLLARIRGQRDRRPASGRLSASAAASGPARRLVIAGTVRPSGSELRPFHETEATAEDPLPRRGRYRVDVISADGRTLATRAFEPRAQDGAPGALPFTLVLDPAPDAARVELRRDGELLATRTRSAAAPTVHWTDPPARKPLTAGGERQVAWIAADADGDALSYVLQYSRDGGSTWRTIDARIPDLAYLLDTSMLEGTRRGRFRVLATDGFNTAADTSDRVFAVPDKAPRAEISAPIGGAAALAGSDVLLAGTASDLEDGALTRRRLTWTSSRDGVIGAGPSVLMRAPSIGRHVVTLRARDSKGHVATARTTVMVTVNAFDRRPPRVRGVRRRGGAIRLRFSEPVVGIGQRSLRLFDTRGRRAPARIGYDDVRREATLRPARRGPRYRVRWSRAITDIAGNRLRPGRATP